MKSFGGKILMLCLFALLVIAMFTPPALAGTYYVSPDGAALWVNCGPPAKNGTAACSWQTAMANAVAGDIVFFRGGTYNLGVFANNPSLWYTKMYPANSGTSSHPIIFIAYPGEIPDITGTVTATSAESWFGCGGRNYVTWDGFAATIKVNNVNPDRHTETAIFLVSGDYCAIRNSSFTGVDVGDWNYNTSFVRVQGANNAIIENNYFHDLTGSAGSVNTAAIWLFSLDGIIVRNNTMINTRGGVYGKADISSADIYNNFIFNNTSTCQDGIYIGYQGEPPTQGFNIYQNIISGNCNSGVRLVGIVSGAIANTAVYNNTIYGNGISFGEGHGVAGIQIGGLVEGVDIFNAVPVISDVSGTVAHGQTITVAGSGFGVKDPVAPALWDTVAVTYDGLGLSNTDPIPTGTGYLWGGYNGQIHYKTTNPRGAHKEQSAYYTNEWSQNESKNGAIGAHIVAGAKDSRKFYLTWWSYVSSDPSPTWYNEVTEQWETNASNKWFRLISGVWGTEGNGAIVWEPTMIHSYAFGETDDDGDGYIDGYYLPSNYWPDWGGSYPAWNRMELFADSSPSVTYPPQYKAWTNNVSIGSWESIPPSNKPIQSWVINEIGCLGADWSNTPAIYQPTIDFGEIYADNTQARVEICNASTKASSNHCEIQIPHTQWIDGQLQITVNQGSFEDTTNAYLYVVDADGNANANGYAVTFATVCPEHGVKIYNQADYHTTINEAYNLAVSGQTIMAQAMAFDEILSLDRNIIITLKGGYDCAFSSNTGYSTIKGKVAIGAAAAVTLDRVILK